MLWLIIMCSFPSVFITRFVFSLRFYHAVFFYFPSVFIRRFPLIAVFPASLETPRKMDLITNFPPVGFFTVGLIVRFSFQYSACCPASYPRLSISVGKCCANVEDVGTTLTNAYRILQEFRSRWICLSRLSCRGIYRSGGRVLLILDPTKPQGSPCSAAALEWVWARDWDLAWVTTIQRERLGSSVSDWDPWLLWSRRSSEEDLFSEW